MFSKNAVVTLRNGELYLLFRVGNMRKSHLIEAHCRAQIIHYKRVSEEGEMVQYDIEELDITTERSMRKKSYEYDSDGNEVSDSSSDDDEVKDTALLLWPVTVSHKIDKYSPLYSMGPKGALIMIYNGFDRAKKIFRLIIIHINIVNFILKIFLRLGLRWLLHWKVSSSQLETQFKHVLRICQMKYYGVIGIKI